MSEEAKKEPVITPGEVVVPWPGKLVIIDHSGNRQPGCAAVTLHDRAGQKSASQMLNEWAAANPRALVVQATYDPNGDAYHLIYTLSLNKIEIEELNFVQSFVQAKLDEYRAAKLATAIKDAETAELARLTDLHYAALGRSYEERVKNIEAMEEKAVKAGAKKKGKGQDPDVKEAWLALSHGRPETLAELAHKAGVEAAKKLEAEKQATPESEK